jgi:hypothetical protein
MPDEPPARDLLREGIRLFNEGYFFEAHEVWEEAWREETGATKRFLQGLIQVAAGFHHRSTGNVNGAAALFRKARAKFKGYPSPYLGVDAVDLLHQVDEAERLLSEQARIREGEAPRPRIVLADERYR